MKTILAFVPALIFGFMYFDKDISHSYKKENVSGKTWAEDQYDGPYVQYRNDKVYAKYIIDNSGTKQVKTDSLAVTERNKLVLKVATDEPGKFFTVQLKDQLQPEKSETPDAKKIFALSDIEGNFDAFRKLLQGNGVIDADYNWTFGDGHLVLVGDFFDRGEHVTEVLWLIYSLEDKAKAAGGHVHFVLGNHEIMNLSADLRYVRSKYISSAMLLQTKYESMYDENTELGRWLRTKNVIEKVGNNVFMHGGFSPEMNKMGISIPAIDDLARPYYADTLYQYTDKRIDTIYSDFGPFWYRGYYMGTRRITIKDLDNTLALFNAKHIVTGHTIVADTVSVWHGGRVLNTDVHHAEGKSEALLIEDDKYYRVNADGKKVSLL